MSVSTANQARRRARPRAPRGQRAWSRLAVVVVVVWGALAAPGAAGGPVQGFVSGQVLRSWCEGRTPLDREACLSYLRGAFDTLNALRAGDAPGRLRQPGGEDLSCIPHTVPVTQLRLVFQRYADSNGEALHLRQASTLLVAAFAAAFPCAPRAGTPDAE